jgi:hypothetical protein
MREGSIPWCLLVGWLRFRSSFIISKKNDEFKTGCGIAKEVCQAIDPF